MDPFANELVALDAPKAPTRQPDHPHGNAGALQCFQHITTTMGSMPTTPELLVELEAELINCRRCPRLVAWREQVAEVKRAAFQEETYWARPVPSLGATDARLVIVGLAPSAHGGNRTGR